MKSILNLNGLWKFIPTYDQKPNNNHNVIEFGVPLYSHKDLVRTAWETVAVPGVWQRYAEKYSVFEGVCWYYREFEIEELTDTTFANLVFKGVNYRTDLYINAQYVGFHESGYTEFSFDITKYLQKGLNSIAVQVDNRPTEVKWPNDWGYGVFGGIHRDVYIELFDENSLYDIALTPDYDVQRGVGLLKLEAKGTASELVLKTEKGEFSIRGENNCFKGEFELEGVTPWDPENPVLYGVELCVGDEVYAQYNLGFRNVMHKNRQILLNGKPIEIKGACYLCDSPENGLAMTKDEMRNDLVMMKKAYVNSVRTHYPMSDSFYELCDELGLMVWIEPNVYCSKPDINTKNTIFAQQDMIDVAVSMTKEMIFGARRFASVIIYGIGNECNTEHPETVPFFENLSDVVRSLDSSRLVGYASLYGLVGKIAHTVDIMGINSYCGWYGTIDTFKITDERNGEMRVADVSAVLDIIDKVESCLDKDTVILLTEFGADSVPGDISPECALWSENYHAQVVEKYIEAGRHHKAVTGYYVFAFTDYNDPSKPVNGRWNGYNLKGMLSYDRKIKLPYYALQKMYECD